MVMKEKERQIKTKIQEKFLDYEESQADQMLEMALSIDIEKEIEKRLSNPSIRASLEYHSNKLVKSDKSRENKKFESPRPSHQLSFMQDNNSVERNLIQEEAIFRSAETGRNSILVEENGSGVTFLSRCDKKIAESVNRRPTSIREDYTS
jgi:hypothetical protein